MINAGSWIVPTYMHRFSLLVTPPQQDQEQSIKALLSSLNSTAPDLLHPRGLQVVTGVWGGPVEVRIEALTGIPLSSDDNWEDIEETSVTLSEGLVTLGHDEDRSIEIGFLRSSDPFIYRFRIHSTGRDRNRDLIVETPKEKYLLQFWVEPTLRPPEDIQSTSSYGSRNYESIDGQAIVVSDDQ